MFPSLAKYHRPAFIHSPLNYTGGKFKLLDKIIPLFPKNIGVFFDMFAGGLNVGINVQCRHLVANDVCVPLINLYRYLKQTEIPAILERITECRKAYNLSDKNADGYNALREHYNGTPADDRDPVELFCLVCHSFNHQIRFNAEGCFNMPFGKERSEYNDSIQSNLVKFCGALQEKSTELWHRDYKDLVFDFLEPGDLLYADPPYLISEATYNMGWTAEDDRTLMRLFDDLDSRGISFALSNVLEHRGQRNEALCEWSSKYHVHRLAMDYSNCNYHSKNDDENTCEVLVTNY